MIKKIAFPLFIFSLLVVGYFIYKSHFIESVKESNYKLVADLESFKNAQETIDPIFEESFEKTIKATLIHRSRGLSIKHDHIDIFLTNFIERLSTTKENHSLIEELEYLQKTLRN